MRARALFLFLLASYLPLLSVGACVPEFDTDLSQISAPRVLAIAASPAEAAGRQTVTLSALVVGPDGEPTPVLDWRVCLARKALTELGPVSPACLEPRPASADVQRLPPGNSAEFALDQDVCRSFGPLRPTPKPGEPAGRPVDADVTGGFYQPVVGTLDDSVTLGAVRITCDPINVNRDQALEYKERYRPNEAPRIASVSIGDDALVPDDAAFELPLGPTRLRARWNECPTESACGDGLCTEREDKATCAEDCEAPHGCTGAEPYVWYDRENQRVAPRHEGISVAWYTSNGRFESEQTGLDENEAQRRTDTENVWQPARPGPATVWLVIRDTRGGLSWKTVRFVVSG
ncbi:MAG: hypothetical protein EOO73_31575 [Myxococcales bacterium]|nr:MAG: hypothetical protein EOO73_31575 [Myxococcales bacterium]